MICIAMVQSIPILAVRAVDDQAIFDPCIKGWKSMASSLSDLVDDVALGLGPEAPYFREKSDRLYLSGVEIALAIAVGLTSSYLSGLYKGAKKKLASRGEADGEHLVDAALRRLTEIRNKITGARTAPDASQLISQAQHELIESASIDEMKALAADADNSLVLEEVKAFLIEVGYPHDLVSARAPELVEEIRSEVDRP